MIKWSEFEPWGHSVVFFGKLLSPRLLVYTQLCEWVESGGYSTHPLQGDRSTCTPNHVMLRKPEVHCKWQPDGSLGSNLDFT